MLYERKNKKQLIAELKNIIIIKDHKGIVDVHSEIGKGSIFSVYLPVI